MRRRLHWFTRRWLAFGRGPVGWVVSILLGLTTLLILVGAFLAWRVEKAPMSLNFAVPAIEEALSPSDAAFDVTLGGFRLRREGLRFVFEAEDLAVFRVAEDGVRASAPLALLPLAEIRLSLAALLNEGLLAPVRVDAAGLVVRAERGAEGIELFFGGEDSTDDDSISLAAFRQLLRDDPRLRYLQSVSLSELSLRLSDPVLGISWRTEGTIMRLINDPAGLIWRGQVAITAHGGDMTKEVVQGGVAHWSVTLPTPVEDTAVGEADGVVEEAIVQVQLTGIEPAPVLGLIPQLREVLRWEGAVTARLNSRFPLQTMPSSVAFDVDVAAGSVTLPFAAKGLPFEAVHAEGRLRLRDRALELDELTVRHGRGTARLHGYGAVRDEGTARVSLLASGLHLGWLSPIIPGGETLSGIDLALSTDLDAVLNTEGGFDEASLFVRTDPGTVDLGDRLPETLRIGASTLDLRISERGRYFDLPRARIVLPTADDDREITIAVRGKAEKGAAGSLRIETTGLDERDLKRLWPKGVGEGARVWIVENVKRGQMSDVTADVTFSLPDGSGPPEPQNIAVDTRMKIAGLDLVYWEPLPPATDLTADARITEKLFEATVTGGSSGGMRVRGGNLLFTGIDKGKGYERTSMSFDLAGPLARLMAILDRDPLRFARYLDMKPKDLGGTISGTLNAAFPPIEELALDDIEISAKGTTQDAVIPGAAFGQDLTKGRFAFAVDKAALKLDGAGRMAGTGVKLNADLRFASRKVPYRSRIKLQATADNAVRRRIGLSGFPFSDDVISGPVAVDLTATEQVSGTTVIDVAADLSKARLATPVLDWRHDPGEFAAAKARVIVEKGRLRRVDPFRITAPQLTLVGAAEWPEKGKAAPSVTISELQHGAGTALAVQGRPGKGGAYRLSVTGPRLDARGIIKRLAEPSSGSKTADDDGQGAIAADLSIGSLRLGSGPSLRNLKGSVYVSGGKVSAVSLGAQTQRGARVDAEMGGAGDAALHAGDAGALLNSLGVTERLLGGRLQVNAKLPRGDAPITGTALIWDAELREAPFMMRLLSGGSIDPPEQVRNWEIDQMDVNYSLNGGVLAMQDGRVAGGELGATFEGWVDLNRDRLDISGAIVPAYSVNRVLRAIPLLGDVLTGGEGLFAANYRATGSLDGPDFNINPLTALAPGLLRRLFGDSASEPPPAQK